jgi:DNA-binding XRE family transcriptional regulator
MAKRPEIVIANGASAGRRYTVPAGGLRLGRSSSNDIQLPDEELSRNHCMFELSGEEGIKITDLASANGTIVNGREIGSEPVELKAGDVIEVGSTTVNIVGEEPPAVPESVDLGLGGGAPGAESGAAKADPGKKRSPVSIVLWIVALLLASAAVYFMLMPPPEMEESRPQEVREIRQVVQEVIYEKVEADSEGIFRYEMTLSPDGVLKVSIDDVPKENRHLTKSEKRQRSVRVIFTKLTEQFYDIEDLALYGTEDWDPNAFHSSDSTDECFNSEFISKLYTLRREANLTQQELADEADVHITTISRIERGDRGSDKLTLDTAARLAEALGCHAEELLD